MKKLAIIGGGAAGLAAAVAAGEALRAKGQDGAPRAVDVAVYEADERVGRSILATGNGRCNFSNAHIDTGLYRNGDFVAAALRSLKAQHGESRGEATMRVLDEDPVREFFATVGLEWREDAGGRLYPCTNKASTVLDVLRTASAAAGVYEVCGAEVLHVAVPEHAGSRFHLRFADGAVEHADAVVIACGGKGFEGLLPERYGAAAPRPVLGPLRTRGTIARSLDNIRVRASLTLRGADGAAKARETGELLFRSYGVSGIAVFNLSRFAAAGDTLAVDLLPDVASPDCEAYLFRRRKRMAAALGALTCEAFLRGLLLPSVARVVLDQAKLQAAAPLRKADVAPLAEAVKALPLRVEGIGDARQCQVTRGGLSVDAFDADTLGSHRDGGLFAAGEALDVDAPCGGYNLHWAWASGLVAGRMAVRWLLE